MKTQSHFRACLLIASVLLFTSAVQAQPYTFTGPGDWTDETKWSPSYPGLSISFGSTAIVNGSCSLGANTLNIFSGTVEINGSLSAAGGTINMNGGQLTNNGTLTHDGASGLTLSLTSGSFTNSPSGVFNCSADLALGSVALDNAGLYNVSANLSAFSGANSGTISGSGNLSLYSNFTNASGGVIGSAGFDLVLSASTLTNNGTLHFYDTYSMSTGVIDNVSGTMNIQAGAVFTISGGNVFVKNTAVLNIAGTLTPSSGFISFESGSTLNVNSGGILNLGLGSFQNNGTTFNVNSGGVLNLNNGFSLSLPAGYVLNNAGTVATTSTGTLNLTGGTFNNTGSITHNTAALTLTLNSGAFNNNAGGTLTLASPINVGATLSNAASATIVNQNTLTLSTSMSSSGTINNTGTLQSTNGRTLTILAGALNNTGTILHGSTPYLQLSVEGTGALNNNVGGVLNLNAALPWTGGAFANAGTLNLNSSMAFSIPTGLTLTNSGTISGDGSGTLQVSGGTFNNTGTGAFNSVYLTLSSGAVSNAVGGVLNLAGGGAFSGGSLTNNGTVDFNQVLNWTGGTIANGGTMNFNQTPTWAGGGLTNSGTLNLNQSLTMTSGDLTNDAVVNVNANLAMGGMTLTNNATLNVNTTVFNIQTGAVLNNGGTLTSASTGTLTLSGGTLNNAASLTHNPAALTLDLASGTFNNASGATLTFATAATVGCTLNNASGATLNNQHNLTLSADLTNHGTVTNNGTLLSSTGAKIVLMAGSTLTNAGGTLTHGTAPAFSLGIMGAANINNASGGVFNLDSPLDIGSSSLTNNHHLNYNALLSWTGSGFTNAANLRIGNGATLVVSAGRTFTNSGTIEALFSSQGFVEINGGTLNNTGSISSSNDMTVAFSSGQFNNQSGGTFQVTSFFTSITGGVFTNHSTLALNATGFAWQGGSLVNHNLLYIYQPTALANSTLTNQGNLYLGTQDFFIWAGSTVNNHGTIWDLVSNATIQLDGGTMNNYGQLSNTNNISLHFNLISGVFNNQAGGIFNSINHLTIAAACTLNNYGSMSNNNFSTLTLNGTLNNTGNFLNNFQLTINGTFNSSNIFQNTGNGNITSTTGGALNLTAGTATNDGHIFVGGADGVALNLYGSALLQTGSGSTLQLYSDLGGTGGTVNFSGGTLTLYATTLSVPVGRTLTIQTSSIIPNPTGVLLLNGGILNSHTNWTLSPGSLLTFTMSSGTFNNVGSATLNVETSFTANGTFNNAGTLNVNQTYSFTVPSGSTLNNSGTVASLDEGYVYVNAGGTVNNTGSFQVGYTGRVRLECSGTFNNNSGGLLFVDRPLNLYGAMVNSAGATVQIGSNGSFYQQNGSSFTNGGSIVGGSTFVIYGGSFTNNATFQSAGGAPVLYLEGGSFTNSAGATLTCHALPTMNGTLTNNGTMNLNGCYLPVDGVFNQNATLNFNNTNNTISVEGGTFNSYGNLTHNGQFGLLNLQLSSGTINNHANLSLAAALTLTGGLLHNHGAFDLNGYNFNVNAGQILRNDGTVSIPAGSTLSNDGTVQGTGSFVKTGAFSGSSGSSLAPGASPGTLSVTGDLDLGSTTYNCEINGTAAGQFDVIAVSGAATLTNASLVVNWGSFTPSAGQTFPVMNFGSRTGTFASVTIPPVSGLSFTVSYVSTSVSISAAVTLPVELIDFTAKPVENSVFLNWKTASELNADRFEVERSKDGFTFEKIGEKQAAGTTTAQQSYSFIDENPLPGMNYYRLRQVDFDGAFEYSKVVSVDFQNLHEFESPVRAYPNPVTDFLYIELPTDGGFQVEFFDVTGRRLLSQPDPKQFDVGHLPPGTYFLKIKELASGRAAVQRVVVE